MEIGLDFYQRPDTLQIARDLLGKVICTNINGLQSGIITEVEAYLGATDKACHAYQNRRTKRTEPMFARGGTTYVYLCYGMHHLFNIVTHSEGTPHAILIRSIDTATGPGRLTKALGITTSHTGLSLKKPGIWLEDHGHKPTQIQTSPRIGIDYAGDDALLPYRFFLGKDT